MSRYLSGVKRKQNEMVVRYHPRLLAERDARCHCESNALRQQDNGDVVNLRGTGGLVIPASRNVSN